MDCSDSPRRSATESRHIPAEITEEILLKLPVKSVLRFSSVSRSWNLMINDARFSKKYRGRERRIITNPYCGESLKSCPLSDEAATDLAVVKFDQIPTGLGIRAVCDGLCCLEHQISHSLFIWNPSIHKYHKLPSFPCPKSHEEWGMICDVDYGLGYDAVGDDYKLLGICYYNHEAALYSLKTDSWKKIQSFPMVMRWPWRSWFVSGAIHWLCYRKMSGEYVIVSFDLSTEEYGEVALPMHKESSGAELEEVVVLREKLCLSLNYKIERRFVLWVMEDYGVAKSWTKKFDISYSAFGSKFGDPWLRPFCTCDDDDDDDEGQEAICVTSSYGESWVVLKNKDGDTLVRKFFRKGAFFWKYGFVCVESLVSPPAFITSQENKNRNTL